MIDCLYDTFKKWSKTGSIYILSDTHFDDFDCKLMDNNWITPDEQIHRINKDVHKNDTLILLGDVGNIEWIKKLKAGYKVLIMGNHDTGVEKYKAVFDEVYEGPLFISEKILLSHEPIYGLNFCYNIHGHDHNYANVGDENHLNVAANVCEYTPINLKNCIKNGIISHINTIHRICINEATERKNNSLA